MPDGRWTRHEQPELDDVTVDAVLHALADPTRRRIVRMLEDDGDRPCGTFGLPVAPSTLSHHFRVLCGAGLIRQYDQGRQRINTSRVDELDTRFPGLVEAILRNSTT